MFQDQQVWLNARGMHYVIVFVPCKYTIYPEYLPDYLRRVGAETPREQLVGHLRSYADLPLIDGAHETSLWLKKE